MPTYVADSCLSGAGRLRRMYMYMYTYSNVAIYI